MSRPSLASITLGAAGVIWVFLLAVPIMLLITDSRLAGNPFYTLGIGIALTLTGMGHRERLASRVMHHQGDLASTLQPKHPILLSEVTGEQPTARIYGTARVDGGVRALPVKALPPDNVLAFEMGRAAERAVAETGQA